ncbi:MAG: hypothetical protein ACR2OO_02160 [Thermomicrobiales bacterium]
MPAHCDMKIDDEASDAGVAAAARSANDLVHARLAGRLSRRTLLRRAAELGLAAPVVGVLLHATGDAAYGASGPARSRSAEPFRAAQAPIAASARTKPSGKARAGARSPPASSERSTRCTPTSPISTVPPATRSPG